MLVAHAIVQRSLPGVRGGRTAPSVPSQREPSAPREGTEGSGYAWLRQRVLRAAVLYERRPRGWPRPLPGPRMLRPSLPAVWGLRMFPRAGGTEELALDRALARVPTDVRAAFTLSRLEGLFAPEVLALLGAVGVPEPAGAVSASEELLPAGGESATALLSSREFDPCSVQTRPTDLLRRRRRAGLTAVAAAGLATVCALVLLPGDGSSQAPTPSGPALSAAASGALNPDRLQHTPDGNWADTSRVDFTAWPARGGRTDDRDLLRRALAAWGGPESDDVRARLAPHTSAGAPARSPRLLFAGDVDGSAVVLLHDGERVAHYTEPLEGAAKPRLELARTDDADVTTAAALLLSRGEDGARFLLAPWVSESTTRDLLRPDTPARDLDASDEGVTDAVRSPDPGGSCDAWPVLQLRSSSKIVEDHSFLVTDLGGTSPVHLTHTPLPGSGAPARQPREATGPAALTAWARVGCRLSDLRGSGVRSVNTWDFAEQSLPEKGGRAVWACTRADTWSGPGQVLVHFRTPADSPAQPVTPVSQDRDTAACSRFGQHVVASHPWRAKSGRWYVLAAGSRSVESLDITGDVTTDTDGRTLAVRAPKDAETGTTARLEDGGTLAELPEVKN